MKVDSSGNVGIGTSSVYDKLNIKLSGNFDPGTAQGLTMQVGNMGTDPSTTSNAGAKIGITMSGSPFVPGVTYGNQKTAGVYMVSEDTGAGFTRRAGLAFHTSAFDADHAESMRITSDGNVGIGTASPIAKLEVAGHAKVNGMTLGALTTFDYTGSFVTGQSRTILSSNTFLSNGWGEGFYRFKIFMNTYGFATPGQYNVNVLTEAFWFTPVNTAAYHNGPGTLLDLLNSAATGQAPNEGKDHFIIGVRTRFVATTTYANAESGNDGETTFELRTTSSSCSSSCIVDGSVNKVIRISLYKVG